MPGHDHGGRKRHSILPRKSLPWWLNMRWACSDQKDLALEPSLRRLPPVVDGKGRGGGGGRGGHQFRFFSQFPSLRTPAPVPVPVPVASRPESSSTGSPPSSSSSSTSSPTLSREVEKPTLQSATPSPASLPGANLPPASLPGANLPPASLPGANLPPASLPGANLPLASLPAANLPPALPKLLKPPIRPGFGTVGQKLVIRANHFLVEVADKDLYHYDVTITPEVTSKKVNRLLIIELVRLYKYSHLGGRTPAYDGRKSLYTAGPLPFKSTAEFVIKLVDEDKKAASSENDNQAAPARRVRNFVVAIKFAAKAEVHHLKQFLAGTEREAPQKIVQVLDSVLRESPSTNYTVVGRSFFDIKFGPIDQLGDGLEYWRGFYQSLRPTQMGLSLNIDVSARSFYEPLLVTDFITQYFNLSEFTRRPLNDSDRVEVSKVLKGLRVKPVHRKCVEGYKVRGVSVLPTDQLMFSDDAGNQISVVVYFRMRYSIVLEYAFLPALQVASGAKPVYLPMELCTIVQGQPYYKKLNEKQVSNLLRVTCQRPADREKSIRKMVIKNQYNSERMVNKEFGIQVSEELTVVKARVLPAPRLKYHESGRETHVHPREGKWNMIDKKMVNGGTVDYWTCISFSSRLRQGMVYQFCEQLVGTCSSKGMTFSPTPLLPIRLYHPCQLEKALLEVHCQSTAKLASIGQNGKQLQLLIIVLPDVSGSYGMIKRVCETELGIVSQCCQPHQAQKLNKLYLENVSLKINVKVGGRNTVLFDAVNRTIPLVSDMPTIIFGADVTHPQPGEDSRPSIAAVVASMDWPEVTKYRGLVSAQPHRMEMIEDLYKLTKDGQSGEPHGGMIRELLVAFKRSTGHKPSRIIFYRDGVSEGQFSEVLLHEVDAIRKACVSLGEYYLPRITFVVVQKRHHTRFFTDDPNLMERGGNISPGTVVDTKICHPTEFDFYLNSHAGIQGTSRASHYHVLFDENNFSADNLQTLTYNLCYTYARCTRSVSIVPPAYYAHLAAFRARYYIEGIESSDSGSASGGGRNTRETTAAVRPLPAIKENVKDVMFYC